MGESGDYIRRINGSISSLLRDALRVSVNRPSMAWFVLLSMARQYAAARRRSRWEARGVHVPPFIIASLTKKCNLRCAGCYAHAQHRPDLPELPASDWATLFREARDLGVSFALLAGGEPLLRRDILDLAGGLPDIIFPVFTNGTLIDDDLVAWLSCRKNLVPVVSLEGDKAETDGRRGRGVFERLQGIVRNLNHRGIFFGVSITVTRANLEVVTAGEFISGLISSGCRLFFFVEYVPVKEGTADWVLSPKQRGDLRSAMDSLRAGFPALFIAFPGDEEEFGGCLAAGRGFVHIGPEGKVEPCPFAPYSDASLKDGSLAEALQSRLLRTIRENHGRLIETQSGCALWDQRDWVQSLLPGSPVTAPSSLEPRRGNPPSASSE